MKKFLKALLIIEACLIANSAALFLIQRHLDRMQADIQATLHAPTEADSWTVAATSVTATIYHAVPAQCNDDCLHTASMRTIVPETIAEDRILAMERTMMRRLGIAYGDVILVEGTGTMDGLWTVEDTMNRRYAGQDRIDFLVPESIQGGLWRDVTIKVPVCGPLPRML